MFRSLLLLVILLLVLPSVCLAQSGGGGGSDLQLVETRISLEGTFICKHQIDTCFDYRFQQCFSSSPWFDPTKLNVAVYQVSVPWEAANISVAKYVTIIMQLLDKQPSQRNPNVGATDRLVTVANNKCSKYGFLTGFRRLAAWVEPPAPNQDLDENKTGFGLSALFAFIPCFALTLFVRRRYKKIVKSDKSYRKLLRELHGANDEEDEDFSDTSSDDDDDNNNNLVGDEGGKKKNKKSKKKKSSSSLSSDDSSDDDDSTVKTNSDFDEGEKEEEMKSLAKLVDQESEVQKMSKVSNSSEKVTPRATAADEDLELLHQPIQSSSSTTKIPISEEEEKEGEKTEQKKSSNNRSKTKEDDEKRFAAL